MVADFLVAGEASLVAHRDEGIDVAGFAIILQPMMREAELAGAPARIHDRRAFGIVIGLHPIAGEIGVDGHCEEGEQDGDKADPCHCPFAGQGGSESETFDRIGSLGLFVLLLDGDRDRPVTILRQRKAIAGKTQLDPFARVEGRRCGVAPIHCEAERADGLALQLAPRYRLDPRVLLLHREVGQVDIVLRRAADGQRILRDLAVAHDLAPALGDVDGADQESHGPLLTSNRTR